MMNPIDIIGLGAVSVDDLLYVESFPGADEKVRVLQRERRCGGLTATALVTAARLGAACAYAGVLGKDELSQYAARSMKSEGINLEYTRWQEDAHPVYSVVIIDTGHATRNIFYDLNEVVGAGEDWPPEAWIKTCKVLHVDTIGMPGMIRAAGFARLASIPVVGDIESDSPLFAVLKSLTGHFIVSWNFAQSITKAATPEEALGRLWEPAHSLVAVTCGNQGCWYMDEQQNIHYQPAFAVQTVDTTGCGDVFHGAYMVGLLHAMVPADRIRFASAAAAIKASRRGGQAGTPTMDEVMSLMEG